MADERKQFPFDVFLSHSAKDKAVVRSLAERLRQEGLSVWSVSYTHLIIILISSANHFVKVSLRRT